MNDVDVNVNAPNAITDGLATTVMVLGKMTALT
jgi:hypothetical protein